MANQKNSKVMHIILWILQSLVAITFIWAGVMKLFQAGDLPWPWVKENPALVIISGIFELMAGIGLTFPSLLRIQPKMTIYTAYGIILLMISASIFHMMRGEGKQIGFNIFILVCAGFIVWGRLKKAPIEPRNKAAANIV